MKKNSKSGKIFGLFALLLLAFAACKSRTDHSKHGGTAATAYQCPMKCEGEKTYPQPGSCPVCKMDLKAVEMPAATAYQCPMKCEGEKTYPQPGSCPVCKMDLKAVEMPAGQDHGSMKMDSAAVYTCPMHAEIVRNEPGSCPICKMDLVKKKE